jgi:hypothetical protein
MLIALIYISLSTLATLRATHSPRGVSRDRLVRFLLGGLSAGLIFAGGLGLLVHALGGAYLVAAGVVLGVLSAMLAIWILFVGLGFEQREGWDSGSVEVGELMRGSLTKRAAPRIRRGK